MAWPKGKPRPAGAGRKKGQVNQVTRDVREMIITALTEVGGVEYLVTQARSNPNAFLSLVSKVVPKEIDANISGNVTINFIDEFG